jgi:hypothetical protein
VNLRNVLMLLLSSTSQVSNYLILLDLFHFEVHTAFLDVMQVAHHYFENGIAHFTRRINKCISMGTANGEVAPFVGHNAFLRWSAIQDAAFIDPADGIQKMWSESNVSEDFDMALRLQVISVAVVHVRQKLTAWSRIAERLYYPMGYLFSRRFQGRGLVSLHSNSPIT